MPIIHKKMVLLSFILFSSSFLFSPHVLAEDSTKSPQLRREMLEEKKEAREELLQERKQTREEKRTALCESVTDRITDRITSYEENRGTHVQKYNDLLAKLKSISANIKVKNKDLDTLALDEAIEGFDALVQEYIALYDDYIAKLTQSQDLACGESEGAFKDVLEQARLLRRTVLEKRRVIHVYYRDEVRQSLKDLREQARELRIDRSEQNSSEDE